MEFAELCKQEGIIFIGPPSSAIRDMGIKRYEFILLNTTIGRSIEMVCLTYNKHVNYTLLLL